MGRRPPLTRKPLPPTLPAGGGGRRVWGESEQAHLKTLVASALVAGEIDWKEEAVAMFTRVWLRRGPALARHQEQCWKQQKGGCEGYRQTGTHHPAEIDHRLDVADNQGSKSEDGGQSCIEAGSNHFVRSLADQGALIVFWIIATELAVTYDQMDVHRNRDNQHQGKEIG